MVYAVAAELMASSRIEGLLAAAGCPVTLLEPESAALGPLGARRAVIILDLAVPPEVRAAVFAAAAGAGSAVIAVGPHLEAEALRQARRDGASEVLTRGGLATGLVPLVAKHLARLAPGEGIPGPPPA